MTGVLLIVALAVALTALADFVIGPALERLFGNASDQGEDVFETDGLASEEFR